MPQVTPGGVKALATRQSPQSEQEHKEEKDDAVSVVVLQVLEIMRYVADPAVRRVLGATTWHVFDVIVSDGVHAIACALDPKLNALVWKGQLVPMDLIEVLDWSILDADEENQAGGGVVRCVLRQVLVTRQPTPMVVVNKRKTTAASLQRQTRALTAKQPLLGERQYYLPLLSDYYSNDWLLTDSTQDDDPTRIKWSKRREDCTDLFAHPKGLQTIKDVRELVETADTSLSSWPSLVGIVQFKSSLKHFADPAAAHPFPFAFHIKLVDHDSAVDVLFTGSMCAQYFLAINDGDVVQLSGYSVNRRPDGVVEFFFEHLSSGCVRHIPETSWKLLNTIRVLPIPNDEEVDNNDADLPAELPSSVLWLPWAFSSTLDTNFWPPVKQPVPRVNESTKYFDFVGMVSFVGRVYRSRHQSSHIVKHGNDADTSIDDVRLFSWIKVIDRSSTNELVVKVFDCSQPSIFRKLKVGSVVVLTKLKWVAFDSIATAAGDSLQGFKGVEDATTSEFSSLYMEDATSPFDCIEECRASRFFAKSFRDRHDTRVVSSSSGDSTLVTERYHPRHFMPAGKVDDFVSAFQLSIIAGSELDNICDTIDAFAGAHVGVIGRIVGIALNDPTDAIDIEIDLDDGRTIKATVRSNPFFKHKNLPRTLRATAAPATVALMRALPIDIVEKLADAALGSIKSEHVASGSTSSSHAASGSIKSEPSSQPQRKKARTAAVSSNSLSVDYLEQQLKGQEFLYSMHLYRNKFGKLFIEVDALLSTT